MSTTDALEAAERRLQAAQLASDTTTLSELLDDALVFTGPDGNLYSKQDDLEAHRSGYQVLHRLEQQSLQTIVKGSTGVTWFLGVLEGSMGEQSFAGRMRYTRTWVLHPTSGWRIIAAHASLVSSE